MEKDANLKDVLKVEGVLSMGYGIVPKAVLADRRLSRDAKAIYAYFASYAGKGDTAFPGVSRICYELDFKTEETFRKHLKMLKDCDYIRVTQKRSNGKFNSNVYTLVANPNPTMDATDPDSNSNKNQKKEKISTKEEEIPKNSDMQPSLKKQGYGKIMGRSLKLPPSKKLGYGEITSPINSGNNNNSSFKNNNSIKNNNINKDDELLIDKLKIISCRHNEYKLTEDCINSILKAHTDKEKLNTIIEHIKRTEPTTGYTNIVGLLIKAKDWESTPKVSPINKPNTHKGNRFHNFEGRSSKYSPEEIEEIARRKRETHKAKLL